ncbi:hypothetical protein [Wolbachia endosymbiont of Muscidifurax uniraptor]
MCKELRSFGLPVICVDARHMAAALSARINKNDKNDARGIAQMMRSVSKISSQPLSAESRKVGYSAGSAMRS